MKHIIYLNTKFPRMSSQFGDKYIYVSDDGDLLELTEGKLDMPTAAYVKIVDADYSEVWFTYDTHPYSIYADYYRRVSYMRTELKREYVVRDMDNKFAFYPTASEATYAFLCEMQSADACGYTLQGALLPEKAVLAKFKKGAIHALYNNGISICGFSRIAK